jgi:malate dehydrogenase (oxaloacetate-decarboxylating)
MKIDPALQNLDNLFPAGFTEDQKAQTKTLFLKNRSADFPHFPTI